MVFIIVVTSCFMGFFVAGMKYGQHRMRSKIVDAARDSVINTEHPYDEHLHSVEFNEETRIITVDGKEYELMSAEDELDSWIEDITEMPEVDSFGVPIYDKKEKKLN